jgi:hypothetical protein
MILHWQWAENATYELDNRLCKRLFTLRHVHEEVVGSQVDVVNDLAEVGVEVGVGQVLPQRYKTLSTPALTLRTIKLECFPHRHLRNIDCLSFVMCWQAVYFLRCLWFSLINLYSVLEYVCE